MAEKPSVLIIGGLGYIGRFLALHIHKNDLASEVRIVDKVLPQLAWLAPEFDEACAGSKFMQADASRERMPNPYFPPTLSPAPTMLCSLFSSPQGKAWRNKRAATSDLPYRGVESNPLCNTNADAM